MTEDQQQMVVIVFVAFLAAMCFFRMAACAENEAFIKNNIGVREQQ